MVAEFDDSMSPVGTLDIITAAREMIRRWLGAEGILRVTLDSAAGSAQAALPKPRTSDIEKSQKLE